MNYTSNNFQLHHLPQYKLFVKTDFLNDTLLIVDDKKEVQALYTYDSMEPNPDAVKLLALPFEQVFINLPLQSLVLLPAEVYDESDKNLYQEFQVDAQEDRTLTYALPAFDIVASYQYDLMLYNRWKALFPTAVWSADFQSVLADAEGNIPAEGELLGLHVRDNHVEFYVFVDGQAQLYHMLEVETVDDLIYFILNVTRSLGINEKLQKIIVSGMDTEHEYAELLNRFTDNVEYTQLKHSFTCADEAVTPYLNRLTSVLNSRLCGL